MKLAADGGVPQNRHKNPLHYAAKSFSDYRNPAGRKIVFRSILQLSLEDSSLKFDSWLTVHFLIVWGFDLHL